MDLRRHILRQIEWSTKTFGPGERTEGIIDHIKKELEEIKADPKDSMEWIDVVILAFDGLWRSLVDQGVDPELASSVITDMLYTKQGINERRKWPDWRTVEEGKAIEHIRE
jgi:hypothetical protein